MPQSLNSGGPLEAPKVETSVPPTARTWNYVPAGATNSARPGGGPRVAALDRPGIPGHLGSADGAESILLADPGPVKRGVAPVTRRRPGGSARHRAVGRKP